MTGSQDRLWLARTGEGGYALTDCVRAGVVALRYQAVGDAGELTVSQIADGVRAAGTRSDATGVAGMLFEFIHHVRLGDVIVTTHLASRSVFFGAVAGEYEFADPSPVPGFLHYRSVTWWGSLDRDTDIPADRLKVIDRPPTFYRIPDPAWWLDRAHLVREATTRVIPPGRSKPPTTGPGGSPKKPMATPSQVCKCCGLRKPTAIIEAGVCGDCR